MLSKCTQRPPTQPTKGETRARACRLRCTALVFLAAVLSGAWPGLAGAADPPSYSVTVTPENFPDFTAEDLDRSFEVAQQVSDYASLISTTSASRRSTPTRTASDS